MAGEHDRGIRSSELTPASLWQAAAGTAISDELLEWPPDLFAFTDLALQRSEAYRFALSPPDQASWPPEPADRWATAVADTGRQWSARLDDRKPIPGLLAEEWAVVRSAADTPLARLTQGQDWRLCQALLTLHA
jgi:hypothetical protein